MLDGEGQGAGGTPPLAGEGVGTLAPTTGAGERTFTQAVVDRIVKERLGREQTRYADYDDLKKAAGELSKIKEAQLSESEKLTKRIAEMEQAATDREAEAKVVEMEINEKLIRAEVRVVAAGLNFWDADEAYKLADLADVSLDDDGNVQNVKPALEALAKAKPHLVRVSDGGGPGSPPNKPAKGSDRAKEEEAWIEEARQRFGIKDYSKKQPGGKT